MWHVRPGLVAVAAATALFAAVPVSAQNGDRSIQQLWSDFNHYVLIARPDLAASSAEALLQRSEPGELLDAVEASEYDNYRSTLEQATQMAGVEEAAQRIVNELAEARLERARDPQRIRDSIERLAEGQRAYANAVTRLRAAGQAAVPAMLEVLTDREQRRLQPYVVTALSAMGRPAVYPLSIALPHVEGPTRRQLARVLAEIGYPLPLPFLKRVLEREDIDAEQRQVLERAFSTLLRTVAADEDDSAGELYRQLAADLYDTAVSGEVPSGYEVTAGRGVLWRYNDVAGLVSVLVPEAIYGDVLAMQAARYALELEPNNARALRLWLMANLRRGMNVPEGGEDPTYAAGRRPPSFYALLAGPGQLLEILDRALSDRDAELAMAALKGLSATAASDALIVEARAAEPMLRGMNYPLRAVRFEAAAVMAAARPDSPYDGAEFVVPALAEAVRSDEAKYAAVIAGSEDRASEIAATLRDLGFASVSSTSLEGAREQALVKRGIDVIVVERSASVVEAMIARLRGDFRLGASPIVAMAGEADRVVLEERAEREARLTVVGRNAGVETLRDAIETARAGVAGSAMTREQITQRALRALSLLRDIGVGGGVYDLTLAQTPLLAVLDDDRQEVAVAAADVVAMLPTTPAQRALAEHALNSVGDRRIAMLDALAASATRFGNRLTSAQTDELARFIREGDDSLALAAARAHGALSLPAERAVEQIFAE